MHALNEHPILYKRQNDFPLLSQLVQNQRYLNQLLHPSVVSVQNQIVVAHPNDEFQHYHPLIHQPGHFHVEYLE